MLLVYFIFRKHLNQPISVNNVEVEKPCKPYLIIGLTGLISTIFLMSISNFIGLELWYIPLGCSVLTYLLVLISMLIKKDKLTIISNSIGSLPYALIPFLLSISVLVATIRECGIISNFASFISGQGVIVIGLLSLLIGNLLNNIPMTMFMTLTLAQYSASMNCIFGVVAASNICAILTPIGSLAGIMFMKILKNNGIEYNFKSFMKYGVVISIPTLMIGLLIIMI